MFRNALSYVGPLLTIAAALALGVGIFFVILGLNKDK